MGADGFAVGPTYVQLSSLYLLSTLDVIHVTFWTRLSPPFLSGGSKVIRRIICAEGEPGNKATDPMKLSQLKLSLQEKLDVLKQLDGEILGLVEEAAVADEIEQSDGFKEEVYTVMVRIDSHARAASHGTTTPPPTPPSPVGGRSAGSVRDATVKLPKLTMQSFKGDLTTWTTFWDSYKAAIHDNASLSDIDKFNYLRSLLQGPARDAVSGLTLTAANYKEAVSVLEKRFGNKQQIVAKHMDILLNIDPVAKLSYDELLTAIVEAEAVINSRPLTYVSMDDLDEPLTPAHLLTGRRVLSLPDYLSHGCEDIDDIEPELLDKRARHLNVTLNRFWERWRKDISSSYEIHIVIIKDVPILCKCQLMM